MRNQNGFTFLEVLAVLVIIGVIAVAFVPKVIKVDKTAETIAINKTIRELNQREKMEWSKIKIGDESYTDEELDELLVIDRFLGDSYKWSGDNVLHFKATVITLERIPATNKKPAEWRLKNG